MNGDAYPIAVGKPLCLSKLLFIALLFGPADLVSGQQTGHAGIGKDELLLAEPKIKSAEDAIAFVDKPIVGSSNSLPIEMQTPYRLGGLLNYAEYRYEDVHADAWLKCLRDEKRSRHGRQCAAFFLLDSHEEARKFILAQLESSDLRARYSAAEVVRIHVRRDPKRRWGVELLIGMPADGSLDESGVNNSPPGDVPKGGRVDIKHWPLDSICSSFGVMKEKDAVPALIAVLKRDPKIRGAAFALGEIGDERGIPALMEVLKNNSGGYEFHDEVTALGKLKHKEAVPLMLARLGHPRSTFSALDVIETDKLLEALLEIGDRRAIEPIEQFLVSNCPEVAKLAARRVLVQLKSPEPVAALLELLDKEIDVPGRSDIIEALVKYRDDRVTTKLAELARTSDSAYMRRDAILGLSVIRDRRSLLVLASLLDQSWPENLKAKWGGKEKPDFNKYFPELVQERLKDVTKQDFGRDAEKWIEWLNANPIEPIQAGEKK